MARRPLITTLGELRGALADLPDRTILLVAVGPARGRGFRWSDVRQEEVWRPGERPLSFVLRVTPFVDASAKKTRPKRGPKKKGP